MEFFCLFSLSCLKVTQKPLRIYISFKEWYKYLWKVFAGQTKSIKKVEFVGYFDQNKLNRKPLVFYSEKFI